MLGPPKRGPIAALQKWTNDNQGWVTVLVAVPSIVAMLSPQLAKLVPPTFLALSGLLETLVTYADAVSWAGVSAFATWTIWQFRRTRREHTNLLDRVTRLETRREVLLTSADSCNLGMWQPDSRWWVEDETLNVTGSGVGGLCTRGATWEDYDFSFDFKIVHALAGWIVRAASTNSFVMIQCSDGMLRPHRRGVMQVNSETVVGFECLAEIALPHALGEWNMARTEVRGDAIRVHIGNQLVWSHHGLLADFKQGTVGFRCFGAEHAVFRHIRVQAPPSADVA